MRQWLLRAIAKVSGTIQRNNRLQLADHLEQNVTDEQYNHHWFWRGERGYGCALGHAAKVGIGKLRFNASEDPSYKRLGPAASADIVFGAGTYDKIFHAFSGIRTRQQAINALRNFA